MTHAIRTARLKFLRSMSPPAFARYRHLPYCEDNFAVNPPRGERITREPIADPQLLEMNPKRFKLVRTIPGTQRWFFGSWHAAAQHLAPMARSQSSLTANTGFD